MPDLRCTVQSCAHNRDFYCELDKIQVGGDRAKRAAETCCDSFVERKGESYSNAAREASPKCSIDCEAVECMYNDECQCHAGKISVEGGGACQCKETECATFTCTC